MTIPSNFVAPNLPIPPENYDKSEEQRFRNVLRLYFNLLDNSNFTTNDQVSTGQTLLWLNTWA
jgi:hypothetical protein